MNNSQYRVFPQKAAEHDMRIGSATTENGLSTFNSPAAETFEGGSSLRRSDGRV